MKKFLVLFLLMFCAWGLSSHATESGLVHCKAEGNEFFSRGSEKGMPAKVELEFRALSKSTLTAFNGKMLYALEPISDTSSDENFFGGVHFQVTRLKSDKFEKQVSRFKIESKAGIGEESWARADFLYNAKEGTAVLDIHFEQTGGEVQLKCEKN